MSKPYSEVKEDIQKALDETTPPPWCGYRDNSIDFFSRTFTNAPDGAYMFPADGFAPEDEHLITNAPEWLRIQGAEIVRLQEENERQRAALKEAETVLSNLAELNGEGLVIYNWHLNGDGEPWENFMEGAGLSNELLDTVRQALSSLSTEREATTGITLRPAVQWFAEQMELQLRENDHKGGWEQCKDSYLWHKLEEEIEELRYYFPRCNSSDAVAGIVGESADAANILMMIADNARRWEGGQ